MTRTVDLQGTLLHAESLARTVRTVGGARALDTWREEHPDCRAAYVHGERHGLWWEFRLVDSFRWQGHICRMRPAAIRQRTHMLAARFGLAALLDRPVASLSAAERAAADLAVALLPSPDLLVWEEPLRLLPPGFVHLVYELCRSEGITVVAVASDRCGLPQVGRRASRVASL